MFLESIFLGIIFGRLRSGKISALENIKFKGWKSIIVLLLIDLGLRFFILRSTSEVGDFLFEYYPIFSIFFYLYTIFILGINQNLKHLRLMQSGFVLNLLPMIANGGKMPVSESALMKVGKLKEVELLREDLFLTHTLISESTRFKALSDILPIKYLFPKVISPGDIVLSIGIIFFISHYMTMGRKIQK